LQMISQMLAEHLSAAESGKSPAEIAELTESRLERLFSWRLRRRLIFAAATLLLIAFLIDVGRRPAILGNSMPWVLPIAILVGIVLGKYLNLVKAPFKRQSHQATALPSAEPTTLQLRSAEPIPSVTEGTTHALEPSLHKKPSSDE
jgi:hypothetical protein